MPMSRQVVCHAWMLNGMPDLMELFSFIPARFLGGPIEPFGRIDRAESNTMRPKR
jgi:hypothetical protein